MVGDRAKCVRLPRVVKPINYNLDLIPNFSSFTYAGRLSVELQVDPLRPSRFTFGVVTASLVEGLHFNVHYELLGVFP